MPFEAVIEFRVEDRGWERLRTFIIENDYDQGFFDGYYLALRQMKSRDSDISYRVVRCKKESGNAG